MLLQKESLKGFKPGVNRRVHLFAAAVLWAVAGTVLIIRGWIWIDPAENSWYVLAAVAIGTLKSLFVLDRSARHGIERIAKMRDGVCLGAVYSWRMWILVVVMMTSGILLRIFFSPGRYVGALYVAIGWALLLSSRLPWLEWFRWMSNND